MEPTMNPSPVARPATVVPASLFEFLDDSHRMIEQQLQRLQALAQSLVDEGLDAQARSQAREIVSYFNQHARQHHVDEEKHIFPPLLASGNAELVQATQHLMQDHGWLEEDWIEIEPSLEAAAGGYNWFDPGELRHAVEIFATLYREHMALEESLAYPEARDRLRLADLGAMGTEMARRRALREARADLQTH